MFLAVGHERGWAEPACRAAAHLCRAVTKHAAKWSPAETWEVEPATLRSWERSRGNAGPGMCLNGKGLCLERRRKEEGSPGTTGCSIRGKRTGRETPEIQDLLLVPEQ